MAEPQRKDELQAAQPDQLLEHGQQAKEMTYLRSVWIRFKRKKLAILGAWVLLLLSIMSVVAPVVTHYGRDEIDIKYVYAKPGHRHPMGTDSIGRDSLTRLVYGGQVSLSIAVITVTAYMIIGTLVGAVSGYYGGWVDNLIMRICDVVISFPFLALALTIIALFGASFWNVVGAIVFLTWPAPARLVRGEFLSLRERDYVEAARATGAPAWRIILRHMLPNAMAPLIVQATLSIGTVILLEAALSFLGFGIKEPTPTWGNMLSEAQSLTVLTDMPWLWIPPGLMIFLCVLSINFLGDGLRDALDPRLKQ